MWLTILEISAFMIAATVLSIILGWILRGSLGKEQTEISDLRQKLRTLKRAQRAAEQSAQPSTKESAQTETKKSKNTPSNTANNKSKTSSTKRLTKAERETAQANAITGVADIISRVGMSESRDDLTKIHGIGPKFSQMLYDMDITSYAQIAKFAKADIRMVATAIGSFSDRVERDNWVAGAKKMLQA